MKRIKKRILPLKNKLIYWLLSKLWYKHIYRDAENTCCLWMSPNKTREDSEKARNFIYNTFWHHLKRVEKVRLYDWKTQTLSLKLFKPLTPLTPLTENKYENNNK